MQADIATLGIRVDARQVRDADTALDRLAQTGGRTEQATNRVSDAMARMSRMAAAVTAALSVQKLVEYADTWASLQGRLSLVVDSQRQLAESTNALFNLAQRTRAGLVETVDLYGKLTRSTEALNKSDAERLRVTETINKAITVSGAASSAAAAALMQLGQAFSANRLGGEELNSVLEQTPRLAQAIAEGMGKSVGDLKAMAEAGKLTADAVFKALESQSAKLDAEFDKMPKTVGQAMTQVQNALLRYVGMTDQAGQLSAGLADKMTMLANNIGLVAAAFAGVATAVGINWLAKLAAGLYGKVAATAAAVAADRAAAAAALALTEITLAQRAADVTLAEAELAVAMGANARAAASARATAATIALTEATAANAAAGAAAASVAGWGSRALALLGGPIGIIATLLGVGAAAWLTWGDNAKQGEEKAEQSLAEKHVEIMAKLDKQIEKLNERNRLMQVAPDVAKSEATGADQQRAILAEINRVSKDANLTDMQRTEILRVLGGQYNELTVKMGQAAAAQKTFDATSNADKVKAWFAKNTEYLNKAGQIAAEITKAKKELGDAYNSDVEKAIVAKFNKADFDKAKSAYQDLTASIREKIAETRIEIAAGANATDAQKEQIKFNEEIRSGKLKLAPAQRAAVQALLDEFAAIEKSKKIRDDYTAGVKAQAEARVQEYVAAQQAVERAQQEIDTYGMGAAAVTRYTIAKLEARRVTLLQADARAEEIDELDRLIAKNRELADLQGKKDDLDRMFDTAKVQTFGDALRDAFGNAGSSLGRLTDLMVAYNDRSQAYDKARAAAVQKYKGDQERTAVAVGKINAAEAKDRIDAYADMAGAAKGFFKEHTAGYKIMQAVETGFRTYQMAQELILAATKLGLITSVTTAKVAGDQLQATSATASAGVQVAAAGAIGTASAAAGVANQALGDPYTAWARMAAMAAVMASLGFAVAGGRGGAPSLSEQRQKTQGTGTVFGDSSAKSASIARAIELTANNSDTQINYMSGMLNALRGIESNIGRFAAQLVQQGVANPDVGTLNTNNGLAKTITAFVLGGPIGLLVSKIPVIGNIVGKIGTAIFGGKQSLTDSGFTMDRGSLAAIMAGGANGRSYADVTTSGGWFRSDKHSTEYKSLGAEANAQFSLIIKSMADSVTEAGKLLGVAGSDFDARLSSFVVDIGKISLKGMTGEEQQKALEAVFSKLGDQMAQWAIGGLQPLAKVGEGYLETLTRVATDYAKIEASMQSIGRTFGAVGMQSIAAREALVELMGGIDNVQSTAASFAENFLTKAERLAPVAKYVDDQLAKLGLSWVDSIEEFKQVALAADLNTDAGRQQYAALMQLAEAFAATHEAIKDTTKSAQEIADERADLQDQLDELTMSNAQLLAKQRNALDASNRALFDQVQAAKAAKDAQDALRESMVSSVDKFRSLAKDLRDFANDLQGGSLSTLTIGEQEQVARDRYLKTAERAKAGDADALAEFRDVAQKFLTISQQANGGDARYVQDYMSVLAMTEQLAKYSDSRVDSAQARIDAIDRQTAATVALTAVMQAQQSSYTAVQAPPSAPAADSDVAVLRKMVDNLRADLAARDEKDAKLQTDAAVLNRDVTMQAAQVIVDELRRAPVRRRTADDSAATLDQ